jgi:hypothetical protein
MSYALVVKPPADMLVVAMSVIHEPLEDDHTDN